MDIFYGYIIWIYYMDIPYGYAHYHLEISSFWPKADDSSLEDLAYSMRIGKLSPWLPLNRYKSCSMTHIHRGRDRRNSPWASPFLGPQWQPVITGMLVPHIVHWNNTLWHSPEKERIKIINIGLRTQLKI